MWNIVIRYFRLGRCSPTAIGLIYTDYPCSLWMLRWHCGNRMISSASWVMMTSSNGNIFCVSGPLWRESIGNGGSPHKSQWRGALTFSLTCAWTNGWGNKGWWLEMQSRLLWRHCNVAMKDIDEIVWYQTPTKHNKALKPCAYFLGYDVCYSAHVPVKTGFMLTEKKTLGNVIFFRQTTTFVCEGELDNAHEAIAVTYHY